MKKMFSTMMLFAAAAMAFVSCQKNEIAPEYEQTTLTFTSSNPETKTEWNGETIVWSDKDDIRVALMIGETWYQDNSGAKLYQSNTISGSSETASFSVSKFEQTKIQDAGWTGDYQYYALYPSSAEDANFGKSTSMASITIPSEQELSSVSFDKSADILWGKAVNVYTSLTTTEIPLMWTRVVAHAYITLNDIKDITEGELVKKVTLTAQNGAAITGACDLHMSTGEFTAKSSASNAITLTSDQGIAVSNGDISFWACINPCTVTSLDIVVDTDAATYTISKTGFEREFLVNKRNALTINMADAERVEKEGTSVTYTFMSKAWGDVTNSWVSGKDCTNMTSGRGVKIEAKDTGANATCQQNFSEISKIVVTYSTNASNGVGSIAFAIGTTVMSKDVTKNGGTADRTLEYDFSSNPVSGQPTVTVTCTANAIYIKSIEIITMN